MKRYIENFDRYLRKWYWLMKVIIRIWTYNDKKEKKKRNMDIIEKRIFQIYLRLLYWQNENDFQVWIVSVNLYEENQVRKFPIISPWNCRINDINKSYVSIYINAAK